MSISNVIFSNDGEEKPRSDLAASIKQLIHSDSFPVTRGRSRLLYRSDISRYEKFYDVEANGNRNDRQYNPQIVFLACHRAAMTDATPRESLWVYCTRRWRPSDCDDENRRIPPFSTWICPSADAAPNAPPGPQYTRVVRRSLDAPQVDAQLWNSSIAGNFHCYQIACGGTIYLRAWRCEQARLLIVHSKLESDRTLCKYM